MPPKTTGIQAQKQKLKKEKRPCQKNGRKLFYTAKNSEPGVNLNGKAKDKNNKEIVCRHLAYLMIIKEMKDWRAIFVDSDTLAKQPELQNNKHDKINPEEKSASYYLGSIEKAGELLYNIGNNLKKGEAASFYAISPPRRYPQLGIGHEMAINVRCCQDGTYKIKFFDPNHKTVDKILCANLQEVKTITGEQLIKNPIALQSIFGDSSSLILASKEQVAKNADPEFYFSQHLPSLHYKNWETIAYLLKQPQITSYFCQKSGEKLLRDAFLKDPHGGSAIAKWLTALRHPDETEFIKLYGTMANYLTSSPEILTYMFEARVNGASAVIEALHNNYKETVKTYFDFFSTIKLPSEKKAEILLAMQNDKAFFKLSAEQKDFFKKLADPIIAQAKLAPEREKRLSATAIQESVEKQKDSLQPYWDSIQESLKYIDKHPDNALMQTAILLAQLEARGILHQANAPLVMQALTATFGSVNIDKEAAKKIVGISRAMDYYPQPPIFLTESCLAAKYRQWIGMFAAEAGNLDYRENYAAFLAPSQAKLPADACTAAEKFMKKMVMYESVFLDSHSSGFKSKLTGAAQTLRPLLLPLLVKAVCTTNNPKLTNALFQDFPKALGQDTTLLTRIIDKGNLQTLEALDKSDMLNLLFMNSLDAKRKKELQDYLDIRLIAARIEANLTCITASPTRYSDEIKKLQQTFTDLCGHITDKNTSPALQARLDNLQKQFERLQPVFQSNQKKDKSPEKALAERPPLAPSSIPALP